MSGGIKRAGERDRTVRADGETNTLERGLEDAPEIAGLLMATGRQITVCMRSGGMRVAAVWQVLMPVARDIERVRIVTNSERGFEDMTISFADSFSGSLNTILRKFEKMTCVATAELC